MGRAKIEWRSIDTLRKLFMDIPQFGVSLCKLSECLLNHPPTEMKEFKVILLLARIWNCIFIDRVMLPPNGSNH